MNPTLKRGSTSSPLERRVRICAGIQHRFTANDIGGVDLLPCAPSPERRKMSIPAQWPLQSFANRTHDAEIEHLAGSNREAAPTLPSSAAKHIKATRVS